MSSHGAAIAAIAGGGSGHTPAPGGPEPWKTATEAQLRRWRGDFFGIYLPELVLNACPDTRNGINCGLPGVERGCLFTQHYLNYTPEQRAAARAAYKARGYTHFPFNCTDTPGMYGYSGTYPPCPSDDRKILNGALKEIWRDGLIPCCIVIGFHDVDTDEALQQFIDLLDDPLLVRIVWPGMEMNQGASREQIAQRIQRFNRMMPWALQYIQFSPGHSAGDTPEAEWWKNGWNKGDKFLMENDTYEKVMEYDWPGAQNIENLIGFLLNDDHFHDPNAMIEDCGAMLVRLQKNGYRWNLGRSFDVIAAELYALEHAHQGPGEEAGVTHCNKLLAEAYWKEYENYAGYKGTLAGFVNGGTVK